MGVNACPPAVQRMLADMLAEPSADHSAAVAANLGVAHTRTMSAERLRLPRRSTRLRLSGSSALCAPPLAMARADGGEQAELERHRGELVDDLNDGKRGPINYHFYRGEE